MSDKDNGIAGIYEVRVDAYGNEFWYQDDVRHRVGAPASVYANGTEIYYHHGKRHRVNGPAITLSDGTEYWYLNGVGMTEAEHQARIVAACQGRTIVIDGITYRLEALPAN